MVFFSLINLMNVGDIYGGYLSYERIILYILSRAGFILGALGLIFASERLKNLLQGTLWFLLFCQGIILMNYFFWTEKISPSNYIPSILWLAYTNFLMTSDLWYRMVSGVTVSGLIFFSLALSNYPSDVWISISSTCIFINLAGWALPFIRSQKIQGGGPEDKRAQAGSAPDGDEIENRRINPDIQGLPQDTQPSSDPIMEAVNRLPLSKREKEIVNGLARGFSRADIAQKLFISEETVKKHVYNIYYKLDIRNRVDLVLLVMEMLMETRASKK